MLCKPSLNRSVLELAPQLLNSILVRRLPDGTCLRARIVEVEAYSEGDPASHSCNGITKRSRVMFGPSAHWYVYKCYGIHWMLNLVCGREGSGEAALIRAGEPLDGIEIMRRHRQTSGVELTNGPGKLAEALKIDDTFNGKPAIGDVELKLEKGAAADEIYESPRVGISVGKDRFWRFFTDNKYVSKVEQNGLRRRRN